MFYSRILFFFKQKTAYEMRISDWSSDVCSSDLAVPPTRRSLARHPPLPLGEVLRPRARHPGLRQHRDAARVGPRSAVHQGDPDGQRLRRGESDGCRSRGSPRDNRSEEHTSELQSLMRISYAVFCLKKKKENT